MNKGVEILLARMETHPEEFEVDGRWVGLFNEYKKYMQAEEQTAVMEKLRQVKMGKFETLVVQHLLRHEREEEPLQRDMFGNNNSPYTISSPGAWSTVSNGGNVTLNAGSLTLGQQTLEEYEIEELKKMLIQKLAQEQQ